MSHWELLARIAAGSALGGVIGYERDLHGRPAGLRTHMLVGLAAATFMVVSTNFVYRQHYAEGGLIEVDASRIAASIVAGMGFLAGGAIMRTGLTVQGLTTAAGLWLVGAIGMAAGAGMYDIAVFVTLVGIVALTLLRRFEDKDDGTLRRRLVLHLAADGSAADASERLRALGATATALSYDRRVTEDTLAVAYEIRIPAEVGVERVIEELSAEPSLRRFTVDALP